MNFDGGFGSKPDSESHAGLIYCCVGTLSITGNYNFTQYMKQEDELLSTRVFIINMIVLMIC